MEYKSQVDLNYNMSTLLKQSGQ